MKRFLLLVICILSVASCAKNEPETEPVKPISDKPSAHLVNITKTVIYTPSEFIEMLSKSTYASWIGLEEYLKPILTTFATTRASELWSVFGQETGNLDAVNWLVQQVNFDYKTVDVKGDSVIMSGVMCFPDNNMGKKGHKLSSVSLVCHTFLNYNTDCPTYKGEITMGRALWNSLVVLPDMQGYGSSKDSGDGMKLSNSCAPQVTDCERVAIDIAKKMGIKFEDDYYTRVMGYSLGGGVMMGVARWMEECRNEDKALFKYSTAFVGGGVYNYFDYISDYVRNKLDSASYVSSIVMPTISYLVKPADLKGYKIEDFWTPQYTTVLDTLEGRPTSPSTFTLWRYDENAETKQHKVKLRDFFFKEEAWQIFPDDMNSASMKLDPATPKTKILKDLCDREVPYYNWTPTHRITIYHPSNDEQVPFFLAEDAYNTLKFTNHGGDNVVLKTFEVPTPSFIEVSPHYVGTALGQLRMLVNEDPSEVSDTGFIEFIAEQIGKL